MKVSIMQPYFLPYIGYWQLINSADIFVLYDDVNFIKGGWINRNRYLYQGQAKLFNLVMNGASSFKKINEIELQPQTNSYNPHQKLLATLKMAYQKAPYFNTVYPILENIILYPETNLAKYIEYSVRQLCNYMGINTRILISSELNKTKGLVKEKRVMDICRRLGADTYINAIGGKELYNSAEFHDNGLLLQFIKTGDTIYTQFNYEFVPGLSIVDVLMFNDLETVKKMLNNYTLEG